MIKHVDIEGFQSLHDVHLDLGQITTIVGPSDSGKSGFFRAIRAAVDNRRGAEFISHGSNTCEVFLDFEGGGLWWKKHKTTASYTLKQGDEVESFDKTKSQVPEEVSKLVGILPEDGITLQFSTQYDAPFLVDKSGTMGASRFVVGLSGFDLFSVAATLTKADIADLRRDISEKESMIEHLDQVLRFEAKVEDAAQAMEVLRQGFDALAEEERDIVAARELLERYKDLQIPWRSQEAVITSKLDLELSQGKIEDLLVEARTAGEMSDTGVSYLLMTRDVDLFRGWLNNISGVGIESVSSELAAVGAASKSLKDILAFQQEFHKADGQHISVQEELTYLDIEFESMQKQLEAMTPALKAYCPFHGQTPPEGVEYECPVPK